MTNKHSLPLVESAIFYNWIYLNYKKTKSFNSFRRSFFGIFILIYTFVHRRAFLSFFLILLFWTPSFNLSITFKPYKLNISKHWYGSRNILRYAKDDLVKKNLLKNDNY